MSHDCIVTSAFNCLPCRSHGAGLDAIPPSLVEFVCCFWVYTIEILSPGIFFFGYVFLVYTIV